MPIGHSPGIGKQSTGDGRKNIRDLPMSADRFQTEVTGAYRGHDFQASLWF